jgi:hypothetical protein
MEFLTFEPSEFQILEDIEFDETIQRPEKVRFYTLDEQEVDAYEKMVPKGRVTQYQRDQTKKEVARIRELYETYVVPTAEDYELREPEFGRSFSWIYPVYATPDYKPFDFIGAWRNPLFENVRTPNFYPRMLSALPKPFAETVEGLPYNQTGATEFLNADGQKPHRALAEYQMTKTQVHEDKTIDILKVPVEGTADVVKFTGYYLAKRPLEIPNPLPDHPFLKANEPTFVESTAPLRDVVPSLDAVLTHGVPVTTDPYREALPFLKLYDVKLSDIPWSSWKSKFPQAEVVSVLPEVEDIPFPKPEEYKPSEKVLECYKTEYPPGLSVREWLMRQDDGGECIVKGLLSKAIDNGSVESIPGIDIPIPGYPETTIDECNLLGLTLPEFTTKGLLRRKWEGNKVTLQCVPLEFLKMERARVGYLNRKPWKDSTPEEIFETHLKALRAYRRIEEPKKSSAASEPKIPTREESPKRIEILAILSDPKRFDSDKIRDITELLKDTLSTKNIHTDADGAFVFCDHTLGLLSGELAVDRLGYYAKWTAIENGSRVCKFCGEQVNTDVFEQQDEYDENGFIIRHTEALETKVFYGDAIAKFTTGLQSLQGLFDLTLPMDATCYLLLSILQVLPTAEQLDPLLKLGKSIAAKLGNDPKKKKALDKAKGALGIAITIVLLQTHIPILTPRRSFGPKPVMISGYPRDAKEPESYSILDSLLGVLRKTFEAYPTSFKGPSAEVIRASLTESKSVKTLITTFLKREILTQPGIQRSLTDAKTFLAGVPIVEAPKSLIPVVLPPSELGVLKDMASCPSARPIYTPGTTPKIVQPSVPLRSNIFAKKDAIKMIPSVSVREEPAPVSKSQIQSLIKLKSGKIPVKDPYRTNLLIASRLADMFETPLPLRTIDPTQNAAELRDLSKGYLQLELSEIQKDVTKLAKFEEARTKDVALYTLFADYKEEKAQVNKLRATERLKFVEEMSKRSDMEREVIGDLLRIGLAPYIITNQDREIFAREAESLQREIRMLDEEIGVGFPLGFEDREITEGDRGEYGDFLPMPNQDGRDPFEAHITDDAETSI